MNAPHRGLWQRLGAAALSGLIITALAPSALAAPAGERATPGDMEPSAVADSQPESGTGAQEATDNTGSDKSEPTGTGALPEASPKTQDELDATVYEFPGTEGPTRIHVLTIGSADAIMLESRGVFAMVDSAEGIGAPDGSDPRYPLREGIVPANVGDTNRVLRYMIDHGVTSSNLAFYLGTHAHSDHIDNADDIIRRFRPKVIFTPEYSDRWITNPNGLWDNQWVYDNMVEAAHWAEATYGAQFVQHVDGYNTHVTLGDMDVQLIPFDPEEKYKVRGTTDANLMGWGAKVTAFGRTAFLAADLMDTEADWVTHNGYEARVARAVGKVDVLKAGHHGLRSSNFAPFMEALDPTMIIQTGTEAYAADSLTTSVIHGQATWAPAAELWDNAKIPSVIATFTPSGISYNDLTKASWGHEYDAEHPRAWWFQAGRPAPTTGWWQGRSGSWYYFAGKPSAEASTWVSDNGQWYWMGATGAMASSEWISDGNGLYYIDSAGHPSSASGWTQNDGAWYYLRDGRAHTGWLNDRGTWYLLDPASGQMVTGWGQADGSWYHMDSSGHMTTGWINDGGSWYYLRGSGQMATGWLASGGSWYYLGASGAMRTGWFQDAGSWYYADPSGAMVTGWLASGGSWYYLGASGAMVTGWLPSAGSWYYLSEDGSMVTGRVLIAGRYSDFSASGSWLGYTP